MHGQQPIDVVIPAGTVLEDEYAHIAGTEVRALAPIGNANVPTLQIVIDALRESERVGRIIVVGDPLLVQHIRKVDLWVAPHESGPANIVAGLRFVESSRPALVCMSDLPFISTASIQHFIANVETNADIAVGVVSANDYNSRYPGAPSSQFVNLKDYGPSTIGGLFFINPEVLIRNVSLVERAFSSRKSQWKMATLLGPRLAWQFASRRLTGRAILDRASNILGCRAAIVTNAAPELAFDIDTVNDYNYARTNAGGSYGDN
jgi:hypothetical protein